MPTANQLILDASLRHQIQLRRYTQAELKRIVDLLSKADADLVDRIQGRIARLAGKPLRVSDERLKALLQDIRDARTAAMAELKTSTRDQLSQLSKVEAGAEQRIITAAVPFQIEMATVSAAQLNAIVSSKPFQGKLLKTWFDELARRDQSRISQALHLGLAQGETTDDIVRRIAGTRAAKYSDGALGITRRDAVSVARTAINHVSNAAREEVWTANQDIIACEIWVSTLDGRTTAVCRARDGQGSPVGDKPLPPDIIPLDPPNAAPPAHFGCRSTKVAYIDGVGLLGSRPTVTDTRNRREREIDFRKEARAQKTTIQEVRKQWAEQNIGKVPAKTTYQEWLSNQDAAFQDDVLGQAKGKLFRDGNLTLDEFVDNTGKELTLKQLAAKDPAAFIKAGLDPADY